MGDYLQEWPKDQGVQVKYKDSSEENIDETDLVIIGLMDQLLLFQVKLLSKRLNEEIVKIPGTTKLPI